MGTILHGRCRGTDQHQISACVHIGIDSLEISGHIWTDLSVVNKAWQDSTNFGARCCPLLALARPNLAISPMEQNSSDAKQPDTNKNDVFEHL